MSHSLHRPPIGTSTILQLFVLQAYVPPDCEFLEVRNFFHIHFCILCTRNNAGKRKHTICYSNKLFWQRKRTPHSNNPCEHDINLHFFSVCVGFSIHTYKITVKKIVADSLTWVITKQSWALGIDSPERLEIIRQKDYKLQTVITNLDS